MLHTGTQPTWPVTCVGVELAEASCRWPPLPISNSSSIPLTVLAIPVITVGAAHWRTEPLCVVHDMHLWTCLPCK